MTTLKNVGKVKLLIKADRHITYRQIEEVLQISAPSVHKILHDILGVRKVCTLWVPHDLKPEQKEAKVNWCKKMLKIYEYGTPRHINDIVTCDETLGFIILMYRQKIKTK